MQMGFKACLKFRFRSLGNDSRMRIMARCKSNQNIHGVRNKSWSKREGKAHQRNEETGVFLTLSDDLQKIYHRRSSLFVHSLNRAVNVRRTPECQLGEKSDGFGLLRERTKQYFHFKSVQLCTFLKHHDNVGQVWSVSSRSYEWRLLRGLIQRNGEVKDSWRRRMKLLHIYLRF
jgi:hypothetical protein